MAILIQQLLDHNSGLCTAGPVFSYPFEPSTIKAACITCTCLWPLHPYQKPGMNAKLFMSSFTRPEHAAIQAVSHPGAHVR